MNAPKKPNSSDLVLHRVDEAAEVLRTHPQSVYRLIWSGQLAVVDISTGKRPRLRVDDVELKRFVASRKVAA